MAEINVAMLVSQTVTEAQAQSRLKMGRDYASFYEAWAVLRQRIEETKRDANAAALCAAFAGMAAEAQRAVEESG